MKEEPIETRENTSRWARRDKYGLKEVSKGILSKLVVVILSVKRLGKVKYILDIKVKCASWEMGCVA